MGLWLLAAVVLGGAALTLRDEDDAPPLHVRLAAGAALGLALWSLIGYVLAAGFGFGSGSAAAAAALAAAPALFVPRSDWRRLRPARPSLVAAAWGLALGGLLVLVFDRAYYETAEGVFTGIEHNLGDLPFHLAIVAGFTEGGGIPPRHPELSGAPLTYPFLADFGVAQLAALGMPLRAAVLAHNLALAFALLALLGHFARRLTGDALAAALAPLLLFLSGGLGFLMLLQESRADGVSLGSLLLHLPHDYTITRTGELRFGNTLICLLTTQRSLLFGAPLFLLAATLLWEAVVADDPRRRLRRLAMAGAVAGLMPLVHAHALASLLAVAACLTLLFPPRREWRAFFGVALALALPQALWLASGSALRARSFLAFEPGWDSGGANVLTFWLMNAGVFVPTLAVACLWIAPARAVRFHLPFWGLFLAPNLLRLSPWIWDNIKFLFFWLLASTPLVGLVVAWLWRRGRVRSLFGFALLAALTASGGIDLWRVVSRQIQLQVFDARAIAFARVLARATPPSAVILRAPSHDSPVLLAGRTSVAGYGGHLWSQGLDGGSREQDLKSIYEGGPDAAALLGRYRVDYVLVGPQERALYQVDADFLARYPLALELGRYQLRRVK